MAKKWLLGGAAVALSLLAWLAVSADLQHALSWRGEHGAGGLQPAPAEPPDLSNVSAQSLGQEESEPPEVIDLTPPPRAGVESAEPPLADLPPLPLPDGPMPTTSTRPAPVILDFLPHSADGDESPRRPQIPDPAPFWQRLAAFVWRRVAGRPHAFD